MTSVRPPGPDDPEAAPKRRRLPGVNLRPGTVKQARLEAGLSLAQLGRGHVTAPAIYLIETGRTRPSLPTLEHIARRTGKPVEFFLAERNQAADDDQAKFLVFEAMVENEPSAEAIAFGQSLLERSASALRLGRIRYLLARAYLATGQRELAARLLAEAKAQLEAVNDRVLVAAAAGDEAELSIDTRPSQAVALAESALAEAHTQTPAPLLTEARLRGVLADAQAANGDLDAAIVSYQEAIRFTEAVFDLRRSAQTYRTLALAFHEAGEMERASRYAMRAVALFEIVGARAAVIRWEHRMGRALSARGNAADARTHFDRALALQDHTKLDAGRAEVLLSQCELSMQEGDVDRAFELAESALTAADRFEETAASAEAHTWLGRIADRRGDHEAADREFDAAIQALERLGMRERLQHTHRVYAEVLEQRGELAKAYGHMKQALQAARPTVMHAGQDEERVGTA